MAAKRCGIHDESELRRKLVVGKRLVQVLESLLEKGGTQ